MPVEQHSHMRLSNLRFIAALENVNHMFVVSLLSRAPRHWGRHCHLGRHYHLGRHCRLGTILATDKLNETFSGVDEQRQLIPLQLLKNDDLNSAQFEDSLMANRQQILTGIVLVTLLHVGTSRSRTLAQELRTTRSPKVLGGTVLHATRARLSRMRDAEKSFLTDEQAAAQHWDAVLRDADDELWAADPGDREFVTYIPLSLAVDRWIQRQSPEVRTRYCAELDNIARTNRYANVSEVSRRLFLSNFGDNAALTEAAHAMDVGHFLRAERILKRLIHEHPSTNLDRRMLWLRLALSNAKLGDALAAQQCLQSLKSAHPKSSTLRQFKLMTSLVARMARGELRPLSSDLHAASIAVPADAQKLSERWSLVGRRSLSRSLAVVLETTHQDAPPIGEARADLIPMQRWHTSGRSATRSVVVSHGLVCSKVNGTLVCRDADAGRIKWVSCLSTMHHREALAEYVTGQLGSRGPRSPGETAALWDAVQHSIAVGERQDGSTPVYTLDGDTVMGGIERFLEPLSRSWRHVPARTGAKFLTVYDLETGRLKWRIPAVESNATPRHSTGFLSTPIESDGQVLVPVAEQGEVWLWALDRRSGGLLWKKLLCREPAAGCSPWSPVAMTIREHELFVATGAGLVMAVDLRTRRFLWAVRYPRPNFLASVRQGWERDRLFAWRKWLIVMPSDSRIMLLIDRSTGAVVWNRDLTGMAATAATRRCIGLVGGALFVAGKTIAQRIDVRHGHVEWESHVTDMLGRGVVTRHEVLVPTPTSIVRLNLLTGERMGSIVLPTDQPGTVGNLLVQDGGLFLVGTQRIRRLEFGAARSVPNGNRPAHVDLQSMTVAQRVEHLNSAEFSIREHATRSLLSLGEAGLSALIEATKNSSSEETRTRAWLAVFRLTRSKDAGIANAAMAAARELDVQSNPASVRRNAARITDWPRDHAAYALQQLGGRITPGKLHLAKSRIDDESLRHLVHLPDLKEVDLTETAITDAGLGHLVSLGRLNSLVLSKTKVTDRGMVHVAKLNKLENLFLRETSISDEGLAKLRNLRAMRQLRLQSTSITDAGLAHLSGMTELRLLFIEFTAISDAGLAHLTPMKHLRHLYMHDTQVTDAGLVHLKAFPGLFAVSLDGTKITDAGLVNFVGREQFERLYISRTGITDAGLKTLALIPTLSDVNLKQTKVTDAGLKSLQKLKRLARLGLPQQPHGAVTRDGVQRLKAALPKAGDVY